MLPSNPGFYNQLYTPGNSSDGLVLKAGSLLSTEAQEEKKSTTERITESYFNVMENRINQPEEKSHYIFNHKSSMKLVLCPRRKGTDSQGAS